MKNKLERLLQDAIDEGMPFFAVDVDGGSRHPSFVAAIAVHALCMNWHVLSVWSGGGGKTNILFKYVAP